MMYNNIQTITKTAINLNFDYIKVHLPILNIFMSLAIEKLKSNNLKTIYGRQFNFLC